MPRLKFCPLLGMFLAASFLVSTARAQVVSSASPGGLAPGKAVELTLRGDKLTAPLTIWSSFPAKVEAITPAKDGKSVKCKITVAASAPVGIGGLIAANATGVSEALMIVVDDLPSVADNGKNHSRETAQAIGFPSAVDGASDGPTLDFYKFTAKKGQRIAVEAIANRLNSNMDPVLRLLDAKGKELAAVDDDAGLGADCRLRVTAPADGEYTVEIHDNRYQGGGRYRLRVGDFPLITTALPLGGRLGSTASLKFSGPSADDAAPMIVKIPSYAPTGKVGVSVKAKGGASSAIGVIAASDLPEALETEPNDAHDQGTEVTLPCAINGVTQAAKDSDYFRFAATKGRRIDFKALSRSFGSPNFVALQVLDPAGKTVAATKPSDAEEVALAYTPPADGVYGLLVADLLRRGGEEFAYRVEARTGPGYSVMLKQEKTTAYKFNAARNDGGFGLNVAVARRGYDGPITLTLENPQDGVVLYNNVIPAKAAQVRLYVTVPPTFKEGDFRALRFVGKAMIDGREVAELMRTEPTLRAKMPQLLYPHPWQDGLISMTTTAPAAAFYGVKSDKPKIDFPKATGTAQAVLTLERKAKDFKAGMTVLPQNLPAGFSVAVKAVKEKYTLTLTGDKNAPAGQQFDLDLVVIAEHKGRVQRVALKVPVQVTAAVAAK